MVTAVPKPVRTRLDDFRDWVRLLPCCACWPSVRVGDPTQLSFGRVQSEAAHVHGRGAGGDDPYNLIPLCHWHHIMVQHVRGWGSLWVDHPDDPTVSTLGIDQRGRPGYEHALWLARGYFLAYQSWLRQHPFPTKPAW